MPPTPRFTLAVLAVAACLGGFAVVLAAPSWAWTSPTGARPAVAEPFDNPAQNWLPGHRGADLQSATGAAVRAAGSGTVSFVGVIAGVPSVAVTHGDLRTTYQPVTASVAAGDYVREGEQIGTLSASGAHCPGCLHLGLKRGAEYLDPALILSLGPMILKPLSDRPAERAMTSGQTPGIRRATAPATDESPAPLTGAQSAGAGFGAAAIGGAAAATALTRRIRR